MMMCKCAYFCYFREAEEPAVENEKNVDAEKPLGEEEALDANKESPEKEPEEKEPEDKVVINFPCKMFN